MRDVFGAPVCNTASCASASADCGGVSRSCLPMCGKRCKLGITAARNSTSRSSKAAAASASSRSAYIASRLARKLSVSSTRCNGQPRFLTARLPGLIPSGVLIAARRCCSWPMAASASTVRPAAMSAKPRFASSSNSRWMRSRSSRW